eukprot:360559-Chlamydomonas_euryale.AAC.2
MDCESNTQGTRAAGRLGLALRSTELAFVLDVAKRTRRWAVWNGAGHCGAVWNGAGRCGALRRGVERRQLADRQK